NFEGLHKGHAALIGEARDRARAAGKPAAVLTFEPHPRSVFMPEGEPFRLTPFRVKEREIERLGIDLLFVQHFDLDFAKKSAESFVEEVMLGAVGLTHIVVGHDCTFGNRRRGTPDLLRAAGAANIGLRPTVGTPEPRLEAHLFDTDTDLYGRHLRVSLVEFIRPEKKFAGLDALKAQIAADAAKARAILAAIPA